MDIAGAYPEIPQLNYYQRHICHTIGTEIVVEDTTDYQGVVTLTLMTQEEPVGMAILN